MARRIFLFDSPDRFTTGTVGEPGHRIFFLQARRAKRLVTVTIEKEQVSVLADRLGQLLEEMRRRGVDVPLDVSDAARDTEPLDEPLLEQFRVGSMVLSWDGESPEIEIEARAQVDEEEDDEEDDEEEDEEEDASAGGPDLLRVHLSAAAVGIFVERARRVVAAGRPLCPFCGLPLNPEGHICPRRNGHIH
ncbi:MAG: DUF3090 family protein [Candidatus Limnocylindrales bacterium]